MIIRPSSLAKFLRCEYLWHTREVMGVVTPERHDARFRGTLFHAMMEQAIRIYAEQDFVFAYEGGQGEEMTRWVCGELYRDRGVMADEVLAREVLESVRYHVPRLDLPSWEVLRTRDGRPCIELELTAPYGDDGQHTIAHRIDLAVRKRESGRAYHVDFKSSADNIQRPNSTDRDYQLLFARYLLREHGVDVDGSLLLHMRSKAPTPPEVVYKGKKNERLSTSKDQACDWPTYEAAVRARGEDPHSEVYAGMHEALKSNVFAKWQPDVSTPTAERLMWAQLDRVLDRMHALASGDTPVRNFGYACRPSPKSSGCDYNTWCSAGMHDPSGHDVSQVGMHYQLTDSSPLVQIRRANADKSADPGAPFVAFAARNGSPNHEPLSPFVPK